jgi:asparagine synthase (glutamine-hydrolysing)
VTASGAKTLLTGHSADQLLFDQAYLVDLLRAGHWGTIRTHLNEYLRWFPDARGNEFRTQFVSDVLEHALPPWARGSVRAVKRLWNHPAPWDDWYCESFRREARPDVFPHDEGATALASALYREVRSQYHHLGREWNAKVAAHYGVDAAFPFLDRDLVDFLIGAPANVLVRGGVPKVLLRESLRGTVPETILRRRTQGDFTEAVNRSTRQDFAAVEKMLGRDSLVIQLGYVNADKLLRGLAAARAALERSTTSVVSWRITAVAALEIWLRQFIVRPEINREESTWRKTSLVSTP